MAGVCILKFTTQNHIRYALANEVPFQLIHVYTQNKYTFLLFFILSVVFGCPLLRFARAQYHNINGQQIILIKPAWKILRSTSVALEYWNSTFIFWLSFRWLKNTITQQQQHHQMETSGKTTMCRNKNKIKRKTLIDK